MAKKAVKVAIGPHPSATPGATLRKTGCDVALRGEPDQVLPELASRPWREIAGCCFKEEDGFHLSPSSAATDMPIWRVFSLEGGWPGQPLTEELSWTEAWERCEAAGHGKPGSRFTVDHCIPFGPSSRRRR